MQQRRRSLVRRSNTPGNVGASVLPPLLARGDGATTTTRAILAAATLDDGELSRSASYLRAIARHAQPVKVARSKPTQSPRAMGVQLQPLDRLDAGSRDAKTSNNNSNNHEADADLVLAEMWRVATTTATLHGASASRSPPPVASNNHVNHERLGRTPTPRNSPERDGDDSSPALGTTLARYRRLVGMHARKTLVRIVAGAAARVAQTRREHRSSVRIQRQVRRFLGRRRRERVRYDRVVAAEMLQGWWRVVVARRRLETLRLDERMRQHVALERLTAMHRLERFLCRCVRIRRENRQRRRVLREELQRCVETRARQIVARALSTWWRREQAKKPSTAGGHREELIKASSVRVATRHQNLENDQSQQREATGPAKVVVEPSAAGPRIAEERPDSETGTLDSFAHHSCEPAQKQSDQPTTYTSLLVQRSEDTHVAAKVEEARSADASFESMRGYVAVIEVSPLREEAVRTSPPSSVVERACGVELSQRCEPVESVHATRPSASVVEGPGIEPEGYDESTGAVGGAVDVSSDSATEGTDTVALVMTGPPNLATRPAARVVGHFLSVHCLPRTRSRLAARHGAATRIQQRVRLRLAHHEAAFRRQLHVVSLRSELQAQWLASEARLLASVYGYGESVSDPVRAHAPGERAVPGDGEPDEDEELEFEFDDGDHDDVDGARLAAGPAWIEILPTRAGRIPQDLRIDFSRGGPTDRKAPSLGLWKWSWASEQWEPRRDLLHQR